MPKMTDDVRERMMVFEPLGDGGIAHYAYNLVRALSEYGSKPLLYTTSKYEFKDKSWSKGTLRTGLFRMTFFIILMFPSLDVEYGPLALLRRFLKLIEYPFNALESVLFARQNGIRILHLQTVNSVDFIVVLIARLFGMKVVTTVHNVNPLHGKMTGPHQRLLQWMYDFSHRLIIHTEAGKIEICELFNLAPEKITVIPHGDYSFFVDEQSQNTSKVEVETVSGDMDLLFFGAIRHNKGLDILLKALPLIRRDHPNCRINIVGEPVGGFEVYRKIINQLNLGEAVFENLAYVKNDAVASYFMSAAITVLPYREITQSGVIQIAFACGTPVIATDLPGFREIIKHGVNGLLVQPEDPVALSKACCELLSNQKRAQKMGLKAKYLMQRDFSWKTIAHRTKKEVYLKMV